MSIRSTMKLPVLLAFAIVATAAAASVERAVEEPEAIVSQTAEVNPDGSYVNKFETAKGIVIQEEGVLKDFGNGDNAVVSRGSYVYTDRDGKSQEFKWVADENGFQVESDALPTTPKIPEAIVRSLEWNAAHPPKVENDAKEGKESPKKF